MKRFKPLTAALLACSVAAIAAGAATSANAATLLYDLSAAPHQGNLGNTETYTVGGLSIIASGFNWQGTGTTGLQSPTDLYGKRLGGDENGLGLTNDPTKQDEIGYRKGYVQLDVNALIGNVMNVMFRMGSTSKGEEWTVYGSNTAGGTCHVGPCGGVSLTSGTGAGVDLALPGFGTYRYYDFVSTKALGGRNVLLTDISATTSGTPEPASWALMLVGFGGLGAMLRRRRATLATA